MKKIMSFILLFVGVLTLAACTTKGVVTVDFDVNGGKEATYEQQVVNSGESIERVQRPTKEGSDFIGWHDNAKGKGKAFNFHTGVVKKNTTFYAKYQEAVTTTEQATVTFNTPKGATEVASIKTTIGKLLGGEPVQPALAEHDFVWWYTDAKLKKPFNLDGDIITGDITLYAKFKAKATTAYAGVLRYTISSTSSLNPYADTLNTSSTLMSYISANLYETDIDWELAIQDGLATSRGVLAKDVKASELPFGRFPLLAKSEPVDVSEAAGKLEGTVWEIEVKEGLTFSEGTPITAQTWVDSWQLLLDPKLKNTRANLIYDEKQYLGVVGSKAYYDGVQTDFSKVGVKATGNKITLELAAKKDMWDIMGLLEGESTGIVHVENFKAGLTADGTRTTYGTRSNMPVASGPYVLKNWEADKLFYFEKNDKFINKNEYSIEKVRYDVVNNQTAEINEFEAGNIDAASVSGQYFSRYETDPRLKMAPTTSTFRLAFNYTDSKDSTGEAVRTGNKYLANQDLRQAIYLAVDRDALAKGIRKPSIGQPGFLSNQYYATEQNPFSYRDSDSGKDAYTALTDKAMGYDPEKALILFEKALASLNGEAMTIEVTYFDSETNHTLFGWLNDTIKEVFQTNTGGKNAGKFQFKADAKAETALRQAWENKTYDVTMSGWQGINFNPLSLLGQVFNPHPDYIDNATENLDPAIGEIELTANIENAKNALPGWIEKLVTAEKYDLLTPAVRTSIVEKYSAYLEKEEAEATAAYEALEKVFTDAKIFEKGHDSSAVILVSSWLLLDTKIDENGIFKGTLHVFFNTAYTELAFEQYEGKDLDFDILTAAVEKMLIEQVVAVPLTSSVDMSVYSERVQFVFNDYHARLGWGGIKYISLKD